MAKERKSIELRRLLTGPDIIIAPCAYDCLSARIIERIGFKVIFHGGYNTAAPLLGMPDIGLITMPEMVGYARNMAAAVDVPVVCDIDDGFGDAINITRTTQEVIKAGLAGLYMEDQQFPKRCPTIGGGQVISTREMLRKLRVVFKAREEEDPDLVVIARTHASRIMGIQEGVERGVAYAKEGADIIFVDLCYSDEVVDELKLIAEKIGPHAHVLANMTETVGRTLLTAEELQTMGFKIAYYPVTALITAAGAIQSVFTELMTEGTTRAVTEGMMPFGEIGGLLGMDHYSTIEKEFADNDS